METSQLLTFARAVGKLPPARQRRRIRDDAGISQRELAEALGVGVMTFNRWERGVARPRGQHATAYLALLEKLEDAAAGRA
jgi:DNA-binding transcriptional regulator YiaG